MRRAERGFDSMEQILGVMMEAQVCRVAFNGDAYPYIVPMNFGYLYDGERLALYFHCAAEGEKIDRMRRDPRVAFEFDTRCEIIGHGRACDYTMRYQSVVGWGRLQAVQGEERAIGLQALMRQVVPGRTFTLDEAALGRVTILRLDVDEITGKSNGY